MKASLSHELEVDFPASEVWEIYSSRQLVDLIVPHVVEKIELLEGDGEVGSVVKITLPSGSVGPSSFTEKFITIDHEKHFKESEMIGGGYLDLGFNSYRINFAFIEKDKNSCIIKSGVHYEFKEELASNSSLVNIRLLVIMAETVAKYLADRRSSE